MQASIQPLIQEGLERLPTRPPQRLARRPPRRTWPYEGTAPGAAAVRESAVRQFAPLPATSDVR